MLSALFSLGGKMKYDTKGMDVAYVQSLYPNESPEVIIKAMLFVREHGYPKEVGIILWFDFILHKMRVIVRLHATK